MYGTTVKCYLLLFAALLSTNLSATGRTTPIIIAPSGHKSCRTDSLGRKDSPYQTKMRDELEKVIGQLRTEYSNIQPRVVYACFDYEKLQFGGKLHFKYTKGGGEIGQIELGNWVLFEKITWEFIEPVVEEMIAYVNQIANEVENPRIYLIGHSWGAWLSMKLATMLPPDLTVKGLATIDPVSPLDCWPNLYLQLGPNYLKSCHQAPSDVTFHEQQIIYDRVGSQWRHFYQKQFVFLTSGPIAFLRSGIESFHIKFKQDIWLYHHGAIQHDVRVWSRVKELLARNL